jgi:hypothetical protein
VKLVGDDPVILTNSGEGGVAAVFSAMIVFDDSSKCLLLRQIGEFPTLAGEFMIPVWPKGTNPVREGDSRGVELSQAGVFLEGDSFRAAGFNVPDGKGYRSKLDFTLPCPNHGFTLVFED